MSSGVVIARSAYYLIWHRMYHPQLGRFVTRDPIGYQAGINVYAYVYGNPLTRSDPSGLLPPNIRLTAAQRVLDDDEQPILGADPKCKVIVFAGHIVPDAHKSFGWRARFHMGLVRHMDEYFRTIKEMHEQYPDGLPETVAIGGVGCFAPQLLFWLDQWFPGQHVNPRDFDEGRLQWQEAPRRLGLAVQSAFSHARDVLCKTEEAQCECEEIDIEVRCSPHMKTAIERFGRETHKKLCDNSRRDWGPYKNVVKCS